MHVLYPAYELSVVVVFVLPYVESERRFGELIAVRIELIKEEEALTESV